MVLVIRPHVIPILSPYITQTSSSGVMFVFYLMLISLKNVQERQISVWYIGMVGTYYLVKGSASVIFARNSNPTEDKTFLHQIRNVFWIF